MAGRLDANSTNYHHPQESHLYSLHYAMQYDVLGRPILRTTLGPTAADAFGRFRTSQPFTLFDSFHRYQDNGKVSVYTNNATSVHDPNSSSILMTVNGTLNSEAIRESNRVMAYQPGKSLLIMETFVMAPARAGLRQRYGYFDTNNGFYIEQDGTDIYFVKRTSSVNGTPQEVRVPKAEWNITPLDGSGSDKIVLDLSSAQILYTEIEWLGVGTVKQGFVINGQYIPCHAWNWANEPGSTTTYMGTACLPVRAEIKNTAATGVSSSLRVICSTVISEGGYELRGRSRSVGHSISAPRTTSQADANNVVPMISIRLKSDRLGAIVIPTNFSFGAITGANYEYFIIKNAVSSGGQWVSAGDDSSVEYNLTPTSYTGGIVMDQGYVISTNQSSVSPSLEKYPFAFQLERNTLSSPATRFEFLIATRTTTNSTSQVHSIGWEEIT